MNNRAENLERLQGQKFDVLVIGAGINGAVSAASLSARGVRVALIDRRDFAGSTSSNSSNLAWGGIKYLEGHEYRLVSKLCKSRNRLMRAYPSSIREIRFLTSVFRGFRFSPAFLFAGSLLYWALGRFALRPPKLLTRRRLRASAPAVAPENLIGGIEYSDGYVHDNDSRFVFNFVRDAMKRGCVAANYAHALGSRRLDGLWVTRVKDVETGKVIEVTSAVLINACGPETDRQNEDLGLKTEHRHVFSKGVHLMVNRRSTRHRILTFFASDGRLFFVIPMGPALCVGTTDTPVPSPQVAVTEKDRQFILENVNRLLRFDQPLTRSDIISERCGVRPLAVRGEGQVANWSKMSRKHVIDVNENDRCLSIFGGKLTDCLNVGDEVARAVQKLDVTLNVRDQRWYGEDDASVKQKFFDRAQAMRLDERAARDGVESLTERLWRRYGADALAMLDAIEVDPTAADLVIESAEYLRCEVEHAARWEMVTRLEDFLRRRSKIELVIPSEQWATREGLFEACQILFGDRADQKLQEYLMERFPEALRERKSV
ncbi:MAG: glycerol-3-phosphate dehydrogenase/oxidase [Pseudomonadota bacterium]